MVVNSEELKRLRIENGLTQGDVAARLDITEATVSRYESGTIKRISPKIILGYSKLFRVPINQLYENAQTEWVTALEEAGLQDPRVAGFIEYLEEKAQEVSSDTLKLTQAEMELITAYRYADARTRQIVEFALNSPKLSGEELHLEVKFPLGGKSEQ